MSEQRIAELGTAGPMSGQFLYAIQAIVPALNGLAAAFQGVTPITTQVVFAESAAPPPPATGAILYVDNVTHLLMAVDSFGHRVALTAPPPIAVSSVIAAGSTQGTATPLTTAQSYVTGASGVTGVIVGTGLMNAGAQIYVTNEDPANMLRVYPPVGAAINSQAVNTPINVPANAAALFNVKSSTALRSVP